MVLFSLLFCAALWAAHAFTRRQRNFWSFQPLKSQTPPVVKHDSWVRNPIDQLTDLKSRSLLENTLAVWDGEFGRTPLNEFNEKGNGRDHNPQGFSMWVAAGGITKSNVNGSTDDIGLRAVERPLHVHDLHATILWRLGLDHVPYLSNGRSERPTIVGGAVIREALA